MYRVPTNLIRTGILLIFIGLLYFYCSREEKSAPPADRPYLLILGTSQDGGFPQAGCTKECCRSAWENPKIRRLVACIAIVDPLDGKQWIIDATPDFREQFFKLGQTSGKYGKESITGIILTHAHIGHYTGLIHLGREVMGTENIPVYAMPRMKRFLMENGPWDLLVTLNNIRIQTMKSDSTIQLNERISVTPILVPHRDEYSETVGILVNTCQKKVLYIPDIDKWYDWERDICALISSVDVAFLDGTFYRNGEISGRDMREIPHPFIEESFQQFKELSPEDKSKVHFIHFNHTNPVVLKGSDPYNEVYNKGFNIAEEGQIIIL